MLGGLHVGIEEGRPSRGEVEDKTTSRDDEIDERRDQIELENCHS
jgi:hypothetical protein